MCCEKVMPRTRVILACLIIPPAVERPLGSPVADGRRLSKPHVWLRGERVAVRARFTWGLWNLEPAAGRQLQPSAGSPGPERTFLARLRTAPGDSAVAGGRSVQ